MAQQNFKDKYLTCNLRLISDYNACGVVDASGQNSQTGKNETLAM